MWQRVQTLYLAISTVLIFLLFFLPKAVTLGSGDEISFISYVPYLILLIITTALNLLALTTWKFRVFQMRTATLTALLTLALQIWLVVDFLATRGQVTFKVFAIFPLIAVILDILAIRGIFADQMLVESASSLRKSRRERRK
ncbi:MAG: DUF4293 family protein [Bacteroidales bacterium]|nr:DUF4293 family protein [Bacteroidales bacterium]